MNLNTLISETLRDIENNQRRLSDILGRCLRIANHLKEFDDIMWFTYNLHDGDEISENKEIKKDLYRGLLKKHGKEESEKQWKRVIDDYIRTRRIEPLKVENQTIVKGGVTDISVASIENKIEALNENQRNNTLPEGLHSLDLYFKHNVKQGLDLVLQSQINTYKDVLSRIKNSTYNILVKYEQQVMNLQTTKKHQIENSTNVFIIHGHNEAKWRELKTILENDFNLTPIVLQEQPDQGRTIIEKFEHYGEQCCYAFAIFTPDDVLDKDGRKYFQARPNVIFEVGWFCAYLGRSRVCIIFQDGANMDIFSDFQGVIQKKFYKDITEIARQVKLELNDLGII